MPKTLPITKHFQVARTLRDQIKALKPGQPLPTQRELMQEFGASQATIDRAIKRLRVEGLVHRPAGTRRVVVRDMVDPATMRVCLLRPDWPSMLYDSIGRSIAIAGRERDWAFSYVTYRSMELIDLEMVASQNDAIVLMTTTEPIPQHLVRALAKPVVPLVIAQDHREGLVASSVSIDDRQMARVATRHLLELGHPRPMLAVSSLASGPMRHTLAGWRQAMEEAGERDLDPLVINANTKPGTDTRYATYERWKAQLAMPGARPSAIYCASSSVAVGVLRALREAKLRVPEDVSVAGADAISDEAPFMSPPLTATKVDMLRFGEALAKLVEGQVDGTLTEPRQIWIDAELMVRESTAPYRGATNV